MRPPCVRPWPTAGIHYALPTDGLAEPWFGRVWLNPPYGPHAARWVQRLAEHGTGTALLFARTETAMFQDHVWPNAAAMLFLRNRPRFHRPDGTLPKGKSGGPMVLVAFGDRDAQALRDSGIPGAYVDRSRRVA